MKNKLLYTVCFVFFSFNLIAQTRIARIVNKDYDIEFAKNRKFETKTIQAKINREEINKEEINHLEMSSIQIGKTILPMIYQFKSKKYKLNGFGLREMLWVDLYACGLYLDAPNIDARKIIGNNRPMVLRLDILSNAIDKKKLIKAFRQGFKKGNTEQVAQKYNSELTKFINFVDGEINVGDKYDIVYTPGVGTSLYINYKIKGTIKGLAFKMALYNIWLSDTPVDKSLKRDLINNSNLLTHR